MIKLRKLIKETNRSILETQLRGEWWIDESGTAVFADGDSGDINHEGYVIQHLTNEILDFLGIENQDIGTLNNYKEEIKQVLIDDGYLDNENSIEQYNKDSARITLHYLISKKFKDDEKQLMDAFFIAYGSYSGDAREYALKYLRWKRMKGDVIETQFLTSSDLSIISSGINDAYGDELSYDEEGRTTFEIEVRSTRSYYTNVPLSVIESKNPTKLNQYRSRYE